MKRRTAVVIAMLSFVTTARAYGQEASPSTARASMTVIPGYWTSFSRNTETSTPSFGTYDLGGAFSYDFGRLVAVEGEISSSIAINQHPRGSAARLEEMTPSMFSYTGNVVVHSPGRSVVPYATGGIGGLTLSQRDVDLQNTDTLLTGNVGGGVKWLAPNGRWGLRGDYRLLIVRSNAGASAFFGHGTRYGQRVYGGVIINVVQ
jgi:hypothetical protein